MWFRHPFIRYAGAPLSPACAMLFVVSALAVTGCARPIRSADAPDGKALYTAYCVSCHGVDGGNDRQGATPAMRLQTADTLSDRDWNHLVLSGRGQMPAFQNRLAEPQLGALRTYIRGLTLRR